MILKKTAVIIETDDGNVYQVALTNDETTIIENIINGLHNGEIEIMPDILYGITLTPKATQNDNDKLQ